MTFSIILLEPNVGHALPELVAHAAANTVLRPGDLLLAEAPPSDAPPLQPGDVVELEIEGIGVLCNRVVQR